MTEAEQNAAPLFDVAFYSATRPDLVGSAADLLRHYVNHGWREGSCPHPLFDPRYVIWRAGSGWPTDVEPFGYWQQGGWQLGIAPHPLFDLARIRAVVPEGDPLAGYGATGVSSHALFDRSHYVAQAPGMPPGMDPFAHYVLHGLKAGLTPHRFFDPAYYLRHKPDVADAQLEPLAHYVQFGYAVDCHPHPLIGPAHYRAQAGDVEPITHYLQQGGMRSPHPLFDVPHYLRGTGPIEGLPLLHYLDHPAPPSTHPLFDEAWYRARTGVTGPALLHYLRQGAAEGHAPHRLFDSVGYGPVVRKIPPLLHYVSVGERQGRRPNRLFAPAFYRATSGVDTAAFLHYLQRGEAEGRAASPEFRARRYASRHLGRQIAGQIDERIDGAMAHALQHGQAVSPSMGGPVALQIAAARGGTAPVGATIVRVGPPDAEATYAQRAVLGATPVVAVADIPALVAWAATADGPVVMLAGAAFVALADLHRLIAAAPCHPVVLDRAGDVRAAGVMLRDGMAWPRGAGADPMEPALNAVFPVLTAGPVLALSSPATMAALDPGLTIAAAFLTLSRGATCQPAAQATDLAATVGGLDQPPLPWLVPEATPRPRALFIESIVPRAGFDAGSYYALQLMAMYQGFGYDVTLVPDAELAADPAIVRPVADTSVVVIQAPFAPTTAQFIADAPGEFAVIVMARHTSGGRHMEALRTRWPAARLVFHPGDLHHLREHRAAKVLGDPAAIDAAGATRDRELALVAGADVTVVVSSHERDVLAAAGLGDRVVQIDPEYANRPPAPYDPTTRSGIAFIGGFGHAPNVDAVRFLCTDVWPIVVASRPDLTLHIIGSAPPPEFDAFAGPGVIIHGRVEDLDGMLDTLRLTVAPLRYGAGVKMKLITSLAAGVPAVVTPIAVEGTGLDEAGVVLATEAAAIAMAVLALYDDAPALTRLSAAGYAAVSRRFSADAIRGRYRELVGL